MRLRRRIRRFFRRAANAIVDAISTVVNAIIVTIESIIGWVGDVLAFLWGVILSIPGVGRFVRWLWNLILTVVWFIVGLIDMLLFAINIRPEKKLRVCVVILTDEAGNPVDTVPNVVSDLQLAINIFDQEANIRIIPTQRWQYDSGFAAREVAAQNWVVVHNREGTPRILDVSCGGKAAGEDLNLTGSRFQLISSTQCFYNSYRSLIGYGAPIVVFVVRSIRGSSVGCSLGPLTDYVTVQGTGRFPSTIAHEIGHACSLRHRSSPTNLMTPGRIANTLTDGQAALLRASRHVTYF